MKTWKTGRGVSVIKVLPGGMNAFLVTDGRQNVLVDTGIKFRRQALQRGLGRLGIERISLLVLTHAHYDHAGNAAMIKNDYGAAVLVHRSEAQALESGENAAIQGTKGLTRFIARLAARHPRPLGYPPCKPDILIDETYDLRDAEFDAFDAYLLHTPGHTPGSMSLIVDGEIALVGDALFGVAPRSIYPPIASDPAAVLESWKKLLATGCRIFLPTHGRGRIKSALERGLRRRSKPEEPPMGIGA